MSTRFPTISILFDVPRDGIANMAIDEALLDAAGEGQLGPVLRFYEWSPATLSLGYFQGLGERAKHVASGGCEVVRRASGGGAILHDRELTYSLILPAEHPLAAKAEPLYRAVHQALIDTLAEEWNIAAAFWDQTPAGRATDMKESNDAFGCGDESAGERARRRRDAESFLCFERRSPGDLVLRESADWAKRNDWRDESFNRGIQETDESQWWKILGSAQRRRRGAVLQHGSLLLERSASAPELPGIAEVVGQTLSPHALARGWLARLVRALRFDGFAEVDPNSVVDSERMTKAREKFHDPAWLKMRQ